MRKKKHFAINPLNHGWDRFWLANYGVTTVETAPSPLPVKQGSGVGGARRERTPPVEDEEEGWSDWGEEGEEEGGIKEHNTHCLFCDELSASPEARLTLQNPHIQNSDH